MSEDRRLIVSKIRDGTVVDHIEAGRALQVLKILGITGREGHVVAVVMNVHSDKLGRKDIVKVENLELSKEQVDKVALIAPSATINIIRNYEVVDKFRVSIPPVIEDIIRCANPNCITNQPTEPVRPIFHLYRRRPLVLICDYCGTRITQKDIIEELTGESPVQSR